jgi:hypothetical protein
MRRWVARCSLVAVLVLTGCGDDSEAGSPTATTLVSGVPVLNGATQPPGSPLDDGFTVPPDSRLIGDVFPAFDWTMLDGEVRIVPPGRAWRAYLVVAGDPREVVTHFQREAEGAGMALDDGACGPDLYGNGYMCGATWRGGPPSRRLSLSIRRQDRFKQGGTPPPWSFAIVVYRDADESEPAPARPGPVDLGAPPPPLPGNWPALPIPGEPIPAIAASRARPRVEPGRRVVAPPMPDFQCLFESPLIVLRIEGDPAEMVDAYRRQFQRTLRGPSSRRTVRQSGALVLYAMAHDNHETDFEIRAFVREGKPTWAVVETCIS